jgi:hypothetical protein
MPRRSVLKKNTTKLLRFDLRAWFAEMDRFKAVPFMREPRKQPRMPKRKIFK